MTECEECIYEWIDYCTFRDDDESHFPDRKVPKKTCEHFEQYKPNSCNCPHCDKEVYVEQLRDSFDHTATIRKKKFYELHREKEKT
ncbi:MAG: hypothetical protein E3J70_01605 [Candidatus Heimdallarchaeota archaeon]|nr:MAG: hypothetical protein E3J70_01605 [Candidatus Heimdallarchaeota archaeon]